MKKYLFVVMTIGLVGVNAQSNPFDLQVNLQKIDKDQDTLLSTLKEMAESKDEFTSSEKVQTKDIQDKAHAKIVNVSSGDIVEDNILSNQSNKESISEPVSSIMQEPQAKLEKVKEVQKKLEDAQVKEEQLEAERLRKIAVEKKKLENENTEALKREEEKREVAAYEAKRVEKRKEARKKTLEENIQREKEQKKEVIADINISQEIIDERNIADKAYLEAVREMDRVN